MKTALKAKDQARLNTIRLLLAAIKQREIDERIELADTDILAIIDKLIKQRKESSTQFQAGNRPDLVAQEEAEITVLQTYLPQPFSEIEIEALIEQAIARSPAQGLAAMGKVMAELKPLLAGRADLAQVSQRVKAKLTS